MTRIAAFAALLFFPLLLVAEEPPRPERVQWFNLCDVHITGGPFKHAEIMNRAWLLSLDPDRFLWHFRHNAGLPTTAQPYGGWESADWEFPGHTLGHYLSACALMAAHGGEPEFQRRVDYLVAELAKCQAALAPRGSHPGFLDPLPEERFALLEGGDGKGGVPYYTMHKTMAGLLDAYELTGNRQALDVLTKLADWLKFRTDRLKPEQLQRALRIEHGGLNEALANLYAHTRNPDHLKLAEAFNHQRFFEPLSRGLDPLGPVSGDPRAPGGLPHGNTQVPKALGAAREFELTGNPAYRTVAENFWEFVTQHRTFITGGNTDSEHFFARGTEAQHLSMTTAEGCNTYNMLKLTRHLFAWCPEAGRFDYYEQALYNHILATQNPDTGGIIYFLPLQPGFRKLYGTRDSTFWCCTGSGMENHAKYGESIYVHDNRTLYVNLFIASEVHWAARGVVVRQDTEFPDDEQTTLTIRTPQPQAFTLKIRRPAWCEQPVITVNGAPGPDRAPAPGYFELTREWRDGDRVTVRLPMRLRANPLADDPALVAFTYGPIVLAGDLGRDGLAHKPPETIDNGKGLRTPRPPETFVLAPGLVAPSPETALAQVQPVAGQPLTFMIGAIGRPGDITLRPLNRIVDQSYTVYFRLYDEAGWQKHFASAGPREAERLASAARVTDLVRPGLAGSEEAHSGDPQSAPLINARDRRYRDATHGSVGWKMKVSPGEPMVLRLGLAGGENAAFDVWVDGAKIAEERPPAETARAIPSGRRGGSAIKSYPIPAAATAGKSAVEIRIVGRPELGLAHIESGELSRLAP